MSVAADQVETSEAELLVSYTVFRNTTPTATNDRDDVPWSELVARIRNTPTYLDKAHCPLFSFAQYGSTLSPKGCIRHAANVVRVFGGEIDYDGECITPGEAAKLLQDANIRAVIYTSPRHKTGAPRWRVLLPFSEAALPEKRAEYVGRANRILGGVATRESFALSQSFYIGRVQGAAYEVIETHGRCIDQASDLEPLYHVGGANSGESRFDETTDEELRAAFERGEDRYQAMLKLSSRWAARGMAVDDIASALGALLATGNATNADGVDLRTRIRPMAESAVKKFGETRNGGRDPGADVHVVDGHHSDADDHLLDGGHDAGQRVDGHQALNARPESLTLQQMLERFVHVARGPLIIDVSNIYRRLRPGEFSAAYAHNKMVIEKKAVPVTALWSQSERRMTADCLTFHPGEPQFFLERGLRHLNIWNPPTWPAADPALAAPFLDHLTYLIPDGRQRNDVLDWLAHAAQQPQVRPHFHFLLVAAQEGTGRSWLAEILRRVWGERHAGEVDLHHLLDDPFNSMLSGKILMAVHEVKAPSEERYSHRDRLKSLLTDTSITINEKHEPRWAERFCARFLMFTNRDDALPLSETDRRVYVVRCADEPRAAAYYSDLYSRIESTELLGAVWHLLRTRDIAAFNPGQRAPLNEIKLQMVAAGRTEEQQTAADFVKACPYSVVAATDLMSLLVPKVYEKESEAERRGRSNAVAAVLRELGAQTYSKKVKLEGNSSTRVWMLHNPARWSQATPATLRQEVEKARKHFTNCHWSLEEIIESGSSR